MLEILRKLAGKPATSGDLRAALDEVERAGDRAAADHAAASEAFRAAVEAGDERAVARAEVQRSEAAKALDRAETAATGLRRRLAEAERAETTAVLTAERDATEAEAKACAAALRRDYPKLAGGLVDLLLRLDAAEAAVEAVNLKLIEAGRGAEVLDVVETRALPAPEGQYAPLYSVRRLTTLRHFKDVRDQPLPGLPSGWPAATA